MKQADLGLNLTTKRTRKREFLGEMERVVPWAALVALITPYAPEGKRGHPPFAVVNRPGSGAIHAATARSWAAAWSARTPAT